MCNINTVGLGLLTSNYISQTSQNYQNDRFRMEYQAARNKAILANLAEQTRNLNNSYASEYESNVLKRQENYVKALQAKSAMQAQIASKGINGNTVQNLYTGYERAAAVNNYLSARDLQARGLQYNDKLYSLRSSAVNYLNTAYPYQSHSVSSIFSGPNSLFNQFQQLGKQEKANRL